ncbi:major capsid protein [Methylococcus sp. Mc7]|uniref:major capsid protein n=1 Tax=Methylococcus sp. Mc7 TaxID=2860258 RepID=UPI001C52F2DF|nr:major capsid protein [Methylococcus sp. Mc7]QXP85486.1 hypothetical protein KW115_07185 [Methylococcus sp. Mc7]
MIRAMKKTAGATYEFVSGAWEQVGSVVKSTGAKAAAAGTGALALSGNALAAVPTDVTDALTAAKADGTTIAGTVLGVIIAIAVFRYIRKAL